MTYRATGSYYTFSPGQIYGQSAVGCVGAGCAGLGDCCGLGGCGPCGVGDCAGCGDCCAGLGDCAGCGGCCDGIGVTDCFPSLGDAGTSFSAAQVWADVIAGSKGNNAAGMRATKAIQVGLNQLGYGPVTVDGNWGNARATWDSYMSAHGLSTAVGQVQQQGLVLMEDLLRKGESPGPSEPVVYKKVGDQYIPDSDAQAGMGTAGWIALLAVGGVAAYAIMKRKKKKGSKAPSRALALR